MRGTTLTLVASLSLALSGAALAQTPAGGGSAEGNVNNPGSVKSNSEKAMERGGGSATDRMPGATTGSTTANPAMVPPGAGPAGTGMAPGTGGTAGGPGGTNR